MTIIIIDYVIIYGGRVEKINKDGDVMLMIKFIIIYGGRVEKTKKDGGVMLMIKSKIKVKNVEYGHGKAELISAQFNTRYGKSQKIIVAYVHPPKKKLD